MEKIRETLALIYDEEIDAIEKESAHSPEYRFSEAFEERILSYEKFSRRQYVSVSRFRIRKAVAVAVIAALVMASTVVSLAIAKPSIVWNIQKKAVEWIIAFHQEDRGDEPGAFAFKIRKLKVPDGFTMKEKSEHDSGYYVNYEDRNGRFIAFQQSKADDVKEYLDAESDERKLFKIDGHNAIAVRDEDTWVIVWDDGVYVYDLAGNVSFDTLMRVINKK